jgi:hypothetical protein
MSYFEYVISAIAQIRICLYFHKVVSSKRQNLYMQFGVIVKSCARTARLTEIGKRWCLCVLLLNASAARLPLASYKTDMWDMCHQRVNQVIYSCFRCEFAVFTLFLCVYVGPTHLCVSSRFFLFWFGVPYTHFVSDYIYSFRIFLYTTPPLLCFSEEQGFLYFF